MIEKLYIKILGKNLTKKKFLSSKQNENGNGYAHANDGTLSYANAHDGLWYG